MQPKAIKHNPTIIGFFVVFFSILFLFDFFFTCKSYLNIHGNNFLIKTGAAMNIIIKA